MKKIINIEGRNVSFASNGATMLLFKNEFGKSFIDSFLKMVDFDTKTGEVNKETIDFNLLDTINEFAYICAKTANRDVASMTEWLSEFETPFSILEHTDEIIELIGFSMSTSVEPKDRKKK